VTTLGLGEAASQGVDAKADFRGGWLKHLKIALGGASGTALVLGGYEVLKSQPAQAFGLLQSYGPVFLIAALVIFAGGKVLEGLTTTIRESFGLVASSVQASAAASSRTADAMTRLADQGTRQAEQIERLAIYAASEFPGLYERMDRQDEMLRELASGVKGLHTKLSNEKTALDKKQEGERDGSG
jgi:hypothetical protein